MYSVARSFAPTPEQIHKLFLSPPPSLLLPRSNWYSSAPAEHFPSRRHLAINVDHKFSNNDAVSQDIAEGRVSKAPPITSTNLLR